MIGGCDNIHTQHLIMTIIIIANLMQCPPVGCRCVSLPFLFVWNASLSDCYLVPASRVRLLVITMAIFRHAFRYLAEPPSSMSLQFVVVLLSSRQRARQMVSGQKSTMSTLHNIGCLALDRFPLCGLQAVTLIVYKGACFAAWLVYHCSLH